MGRDPHWQITERGFAGGRSGTNSEKLDPVPGGADLRGWKVKLHQCFNRACREKSALTEVRPCITQIDWIQACLSSLCVAGSSKGHGSSPITTANSNNSLQTT